MPAPGEFSAEDTELLALADGLLERVRTEFDNEAMHLALEPIWLMLGAANRNFSAQQPWVLRKSDARQTWRGSPPCSTPTGVFPRYQVD